TALDRAVEHSRGVYPSINAQIRDSHGPRDAAQSARRAEPSRNQILNSRWSAPARKARPIALRRGPRKKTLRSSLERRARGVRLTRGRPEACRAPRQAPGI